MDTNATETVHNARDKTGNAMMEAGKKLRRGSRKAADVIKRGGERSADALETSGEFISPPDHGLRARVKSSQGVTMLALALLALGVLAAVLFARGRGGDDFDDD